MRADAALFHGPGQASGLPPRHVMAPHGILGDPPPQAGRRRPLPGLRRLRGTRPARSEREGDQVRAERVSSPAGGGDAPRSPSVSEAASGNLARVIPPRSTEIIRPRRLTPPLHPRSPRPFVPPDITLVVPSPRDPKLPPLPCRSPPPNPPRRSAYPPISTAAHPRALSASPPRTFPGDRLPGGLERSSGPPLARRSGDPRRS